MLFRGGIGPLQAATLDKPFSRFLAIGCVGFAVDALVLSLLVVLGGWSPIWARAISFPVAVTTTWWLNRTFAFHARRISRMGGEYGAYVGIQCIGALINLAIYSAALYLIPGLQRWPIIPLAAGSVVALAFNFSALRALVYRKVEPRELTGG